MRAAVAGGGERDMAAHKMPAHQALRGQSAWRAKGNLASDGSGRAALDVNRFLYDHKNATVMLWRFLKDRGFGIL